MYLLPKTDSVKILLCIFFVLFLLLSFGFKLFLDLGHRPEPFLLVLLEFLYFLSDLFLPYDPLHQFLVLFGRTEPCEHLHHIVDLFLLFCPVLLQPHLLLQVKQSSRNHEFFPFQPLVQLVVVNVDQSELHLLLLFRVIVVELHLSKQKLSIVVVFNLKVSSFWHKTHNLCRISARFIGCRNIMDSQRSPFYTYSKSYGTGDCWRLSVYLHFWCSFSSPVYEATA